MAQFLVTNGAVFPTDGDANGGVPGAGIIGTEANLSLLWKYLRGGSNFVLSGFTLPASGTRTSVLLPGGIAFIDGYIVSTTTGNGNLVTFSASTTVHVYLRLVLSGVKVVGAMHEFIDGASEPSQPANSVKLGKLITDANNVTSYTDERPNGRVVFGAVGVGGTSIDLPGSNDWTTGTQSGPSRRRVTFNTSFFRPPVVEITHRGDPAGRRTISVYAETKDYFEVIEYNSTDALVNNLPFNFTARG
jgi:hypothetical protein